MYSNIIKQIEIQSRVAKLRKHHHLYRVNNLETADSGKMAETTPQP